MELAVCDSYGAQNCELASVFLENVFIPVFSNLLT